MREGGGELKKAIRMIGFQGKWKEKKEIIFKNKSGQRLLHNFLKNDIIWSYFLKGI
jgi:hypothetical protein